jgi:hypothetical protein
MTKLHLGVVVTPYEQQSQTTGDVAEILEKKYGVMGAYFDNNKTKIIKAMENSVAGALNNLMAGGPTGVSPFASAESFIDADFRQFLSSSEIEKLGIPGVPTQAALNGISHRFKNPRYKIVKGKKVRRPRRPSFIDTSLYQSSMKSWFE